MTTRNRDLLRKVADYVEGHPDQYDQHVWVTNTPDPRPYLGVGDDIRVGEVVEHDCGTQACIAGWAVLLDGQPAPIHWDAAGREALGLTGEESNVLFDEFWEPLDPDDDETLKAKQVAEALRAIADGAAISTLTAPESVHELDLRELELEEMNRGLL